jgi:hypothetical protein
MHPGIAPEYSCLFIHKHFYDHSTIEQRVLLVIPYYPYTTAFELNGASTLSIEKGQKIWAQTGEMRVSN